MSENKNYPLTGVKVLDLTRVLAGPLCTQYLGDLGAEIIKIENPQGGDDTRAWGPPFSQDVSAYFLGVNRNKKSLALDFKSKEGFEILTKLIKKSDVVIDNFKPGFWDKVGLTNEWFNKNTKKIVRNSISGYGDVGPQEAYMCNPTHPCTRPPLHRVPPPPQQQPTHIASWHREPKPSAVYDNALTFHPGLS